MEIQPRAMQRGQRNSHRAPRAKTKKAPPAVRQKQRRPQNSSSAVPVRALSRIAQARKRQFFLRLVEFQPHYFKYDIIAAAKGTMKVVWTGFVLINAKVRFCFFDFGDDRLFRQHVCTFSEPRRIDLMGRARLLDKISSIWARPICLTKNRVNGNEALLLVDEHLQRALCPSDRKLLIPAFIHLLTHLIVLLAYLLIRPLAPFLLF